MQACCERMAHLSGRDQRRGASAYLSAEQRLPSGIDGDEYRAWFPFLIFRAMDAGQEEELTALSGQTEAEIQELCWVPINFCPFCGHRYREPSEAARPRPASD